MGKIDTFSPSSGRIIKEDNEIINWADILNATYSEDVTALISLPAEHAYVGKGTYFEAYYQATLTAGASLYFLYTTPTADKIIHHMPMTLVTSADKVTLEVFEAPTTPNVGTVIPSVNHNRNSENVAEMVINQSTGAADNGTKLLQVYIPGAEGFGFRRIGGTGQGVQKWILKPETQYLTKITNGSASSNLIQVNLTWYSIPAV